MRLLFVIGHGTVSRRTTPLRFRWQTLAWKRGGSGRRTTRSLLKLTFMEMLLHPLPQNFDCHSLGFFVVVQNPRNCMCTFLLKISYSSFFSPLSGMCYLLFAEPWQPSSVNCIRLWRDFYENVIKPFSLWRRHQAAVEAMQQRRFRLHCCMCIIGAAGRG